MTHPEADNSGTSSLSPRIRPGRRLAAVLLLIAIACALPPLVMWQRSNEERASSLSHLRRVALGALLYSQDWDGRLTPPAVRDAHGVTTWVQRLGPYVTPDTAFSNPANPVTTGSKLWDPLFNCPVSSSYALNARFWNRFSRGPFPIENLEIPAQTLLFAEAGPTWQTPVYQGSASSVAMLEYRDMEDRVSGRCPYPSTHDNRMAVAAADGHCVVVKIAHYSSEDGPHDRLYGRVGAAVYNWNGGHPNGETDRPIRD